ncbi:MAG: glycosyltransferase family 4 protein [Planctomycetes bacterium]|nr:glycosyltransferase family 4 protein [Planctomycetota bacterium]MCW8135244.1 glycosyltransferase family 4 protein [Planctomycetota bacterium]
MARLLVIAGEFPVASETFVVGHIQGMRSRGFDVAVACITLHRDALAQAFGDSPPQVFELGPRAEKLLKRPGLLRRRAYRRILGAQWQSMLPATAGNNLPARAAALVEVASEFKPEAIHAHFGPLGLIAAPASKLLGIPLLVNFRGYDFLSYAPQTRWQDYASFPHDAVAVAHTAYCEGVLRKHLKIAVRYVRRGVNRQRFAAAPRRAAWGNAVRLLVVGRLTPGKGQHIAIDALRLLRRHMPQTSFTLTFAGGGETGEELARHAGLQGVSDRVQQLGALSHDAVGQHMREADILLIPSVPRANGWVENFCTVASEGLASGLCIVASNQGGIPEAVNEAGILVPAASAFELARGVQHAMQQQGPAAWAAQAQAKAETYNESWMLDDYESVTREVMQRQRG